MIDDLARLRSLLGASTALWASDPRVEPGRWTALSGAPEVDYNVVMCHGATEAGAITAGIEEINAAGQPGLVMVAGEALGDVQQLAAASWACVGAVPFMVREVAADVAEPGADPRVRQLTGDEMPAARAIVAEVFEVGPELARVALPDPPPDHPERAVWGAFGDDGRLASCLGTVRVEEAVAIWSMATAPSALRQGHAARLLRGGLADAAATGATRSLLHASAAGEPFYLSLGYRELERWQVWSRPRWVMGRA